MATRPGPARLSGRLVVLETIDLRLMLERDQTDGDPCTLVPGIRTSNCRMADQSGHRWRADDVNDELHWRYFVCQNRAQQEARQSLENVYVSFVPLLFVSVGVLACCC